MALRNIFKEGEPILRKIAKPIEKVDKKIVELIQDMTETLDASNGVGLAGPQIGVLKRIFIVNTREEGSKTIVFVNPTILKQEGNQLCVEGCLSVPDVFGEVERPKKVTIKALNENGEMFKIEAEDFLANVICHENDHLDGILFRDKVIRYLEEDEKKKKKKGKKA